MHACLKCGKGIFEDYMVWKGGINRSLCESCRREEQEKKLKAKSAALMSSVNLNLVEVIYFNKI